MFEEEEAVFAEAEAAKDAKRKKARARRDERKKHFIRLRVNIGGLPDHAKVEPIDVPCGEGQQLIKWLSLTVTQRLSNSKPSGAMRAREGNKLHARGGFAVPGEVLDTSGDVIDPHLPINAVFKNGDECFVSFGAKFTADCQVKQEISAFGVPQNYMSPFAQRAFYPNTSQSFKQYDALKERVEIEKAEEASLVSRWEEKMSAKPSQEEVMAANFRLIMVDNAGFGDDDDQTGQQLRELNVEETWLRMNMVKLGEVPKEEAAQLQAHLVTWIDLVDNVFKYYTALEVGPPGSVATMSRNELQAFVSGCDVFKNHVRMRDVVDMVFDEANDESHPHHAGIHALIYSCTRALVHACAHALMRSCTHALMHSCTHALMHSCTHALIHSYTHALMHSCTHALMHSCTHALIHSCTHALVQRVVMTWTRTQMRSCCGTRLLHKLYCILLSSRCTVCSCTAGTSSSSA
jgi:hypothetical protein